MRLIPGIKRVASMVMLRNDQEYLLMERAKPPNAGHFVPVGGKLEPGEDPEHAAIREVKEETGLEVTKVKYRGTLVESSPGDYNWISFIFTAEIDKIPPPDCPEGKLTWIKLEDIGVMKIPPTDGVIYEYVAAGEPFMFNAIYDENLALIHLKEEISGKQYI